MTRTDPILLPEPGVYLGQNSAMHNTPAGCIPAGAMSGRHPQPTYGSIYCNGETRRLEAYDRDTGLWFSCPNTDELDAVSASITALAGGLKWKQSVKVATVAAGVLATGFEDGDTHDGVVLATGDRILIKDQALGRENGIYTVNATGAPTRATDADLGSELVSATVIVEQGTVNADLMFVCTTNAITIGVTTILFTALPSITQAVDAEATARANADTADAIAWAAADTAAIATAATHADTIAAANAATAKSEAIATAADNPLIPRLTGTATLVAGTVDIVDHDAGAGDIIIVSHKDHGGVVGFLKSDITAGDHFTISSSVVTDTSDVNYAVWTP